MQISDLKHNPKNPRIIKDEKRDNLAASLAKFGDLGGFVFNRLSGLLVGGHQRSSVFPTDAKIVITKKYDKPTRAGTVAEGVIKFKGERFKYREVEWDDATETAAAIAANNNAGEWDRPMLADALKKLGSFDIDFDMRLTMFTEDELADFAPPSTTTVKTHERIKPEENVKKKKGRAKFGDVWELGAHRLRCGRAELDEADALIERWERYTGGTAKLVEKAEKK